MTFSVTYGAKIPKKWLLSGFGLKPTVLILNVCIFHYFFCYFHLTNWPLTTNCDGWEVNVRNRFVCCFEGGDSWICLPSFICLGERNGCFLDFYILELLGAISWTWLINLYLHRPLNPKSSKNCDHNEPEDPWGHQICSMFRCILWEDVLGFKGWLISLSSCRICFFIP